MGTSLSGTKIKDTYDGLIKTTNNTAVGSSNVELTDGLGNDINISINNTGALTADGNITGASLIKTGGTATQLLLANGTIVTLTAESSGISSNDSDSNVPTNAAVKDYVDTEISDLIDNSPSALDTLNELAAALGDDANFSTTITTALGNRLRIDVSNQGLTSTEKTNALTNLGISADPAELNILDGATLSTAELNFVDGVTSAIQTQIDAKQDELTAGTGISISGTTIATDLTNLVGTGAIQSDAVTAIKMAQFDDNLTAATGGDILVSNGTDFDNVTVSGDITIDSSGVTTIGSGTVETGMLAADAVTGAKIADDAVDSEHIAAGAIDTEHIADSQVTTAKIAADAINSSKIADDALDSEHYVAGSIDEEHLNVTNTPTDGYVLTYDSSSTGFTWEEKFDGDITGIVAGAGLTGDATSGDASLAVGAGTGITVNANDIQISDGGVDTTQLAADAVDGTKIADDSIDSEHYVAGSIDNEHLASNSVDSDNYVDGSIDTAHIGDNQVTAAKIEDNIQLDGTESLGVPAGTTAQRPSTPAAGMFRYNSTDGKFEGYTNEWGEIGGGGGGTLAVEQQTFDGDGSTVAFTLSTTCESENNLQIYIDGVYQSKGNFSVSGTTLTFSTAPATGTNNIEVIHITSMAGSVEVDTFTGDGSDVTFDLSTNISTENNTQVFLDGVYQSKGNYSISGTTITFSTAPANGVAIEVVHFLPSGDFTIGAVDSGDDAIIRLSGTNGFTDDVKLVAGSNITLTPSGDDITIASTSTEAFKTISVSGQSDIIADSATDALTFAAGSNITLTTDAGTDTITIASSDSVGGISWQATPKTANFTATAGEGYFVNTTSAEITVTMPSSPSAGDEVHLVDYAGTADTNSIKITSSNKINSTTDDYAISYERGGISLVYSDATQGWITYNAANETAAALAQEINFDVDFLVVGGAGAGGNHVGGGGGAGGLRTSYGSNSGGGASAESALTVSTLGSYTVTVGAGGSSGTSPSNGTDSTFATVTSTGGGRGASRDGAASGTGGSGGGGAAGNTTAGSGTSNQGYAGGIGAGGSQVSNQASGGGGGASAAGTNATAGPNNFTGGQSQSGDGGDGLSVTILSASNATTASVGEVSGSNVYYAGGGGGGDWGSSSATDGDGGLGGGQSYGATTGNEANGTAGTANTGGGGSGTGYLFGSQSNAANSGGSGVVILRYSNVYSITAGSGLTHQTFVESNDKVTVFTAGTGNISFS